MDNHRLNQIWRAGYCIGLVRWSMRPEADSEESRLAHLKRHAHTCRDCYFANILKGLEFETAESMGAEPKMGFFLGQDITKHPGFTAAFKRVMGKAMIDGKVTPIMIAWIAEVARRRDYEWRD